MNDPRPHSSQPSGRIAPAQRRAWLFGPGADPTTHAAMRNSGAQVLIQDLEDFTPPERRPAARALSTTLHAHWRAAGALVAVRINPLSTEGHTDLQAIMATAPDIVAYPKAQTVQDIQALDAAISLLELQHGIAPGSTEILPVCETALGVVNVMVMAAASARVRCALLGAEDLAADLCAERSPQALELDYARRRFVLECRASGIEPVDAPYTFSDAAGAAQEARYARHLGYRCKSLVRPDHTAPVMAALVPDAVELAAAQALVQAFEAARARGEDRALVNGQWVEVPTYLNAKRMLAHA